MFSQRIEALRAAKLASLAPEPTNGAHLYRRHRGFAKAGPDPPPPVGYEDRLRHLLGTDTFPRQDFFQKVRNFKAFLQLKKFATLENPSTH